MGNDHIPLSKAVKLRVSPLAQIYPVYGFAVFPHKIEIDDATLRISLSKVRI